MRARILWILAAFCAYWIAIAWLPVRGNVDEAEHSDAFTPQVVDARWAEGREVWLESGCQACHSLYGLGGHTGPDLTNVLRRGSEYFVYEMVSWGTERMPAFELSERELEDLAVYLAAVDATGEYPPASLRSPVFGRSP